MLGAPPVISIFYFLRISGKKLLEIDYLPSCIVYYRYSFHNSERSFVGVVEHRNLRIRSILPETFYRSSCQLRRIEIYYTDLLLHNKKGDGPFQAPAPGCKDRVSIKRQCRFRKQSRKR